jgi:PAS domain S-box-containing protein
MSSPDRLCTFVNDTWVEFTGRAAEQAAGQGWIESIHPEDREPYLATFHAAFDQSEEFTVTYRLRRADGEYRWLSETGVPIFSTGRTFSGYVGSVIDITEQLEQQDALEDSLLDVEGIVDAAHEALVVLDSRLVVKKINTAFSRLFGIDSKDAENRHIYELGDRDWDKPMLREMLERIIPDDTEIRDYEISTQFKAVGEKTLLLNARRLDRPTPMIVLAINDITERKKDDEVLARYARDLVRSNAELEQFAYVASHDLQEPLRMVSSYLKLIERRYKGKLDSDADEFIEFAVDGATRMKALINDLLTYSRIGTGKQELQWTDTQAVLNQVLADLRPTIEDSGAVVTSDPLPTLVAVEGQLDQLFQNLISNAIKFSSEKPPEIHIGAERVNNTWLFSVRDNGMGIDPQHAERIFVLFQRLQSRGQYPGTGIGLAICKKIVDYHGGRIWVESSPGQGATFYFTIPTNLKAKE